MKSHPILGVFNREKSMLHALKPSNKAAYLSQENLLPKANEFDNPFVNLRRIRAIRGSLGFSLANEEQKSKILQEGYDAYFIQQMNELSNIGSEDFYALCGLGKVSLTMEYIIFHNFLENLKKEARLKIANLLVSIYDRELSSPNKEAFTYHLFT